MEYQILKRLYDPDTGPISLVKTNHGQRVLKEHRISRSEGFDSGILYELMVLKNIQHPFLLKLDDVHYEGGSILMLTEELDGELSQIVLEKPSLREIRAYMYQLFSGIYELHRHGMIHNDIKLKNVLFRRRGDNTILKIIDFDLVHLIHYPYNRARRIQTTHHFTPPEYRDYREIGKVSINSDIWNIGILFYYLLNPEHYLVLYGNPSYDYVFDHTEVDWVTVKKRAGAEGYNLLKQMLELDPDKRITSLEALDHPFVKKGESRSRSQSRSNSRSRKSSSKKSRSRSRKQKGGGRRGRRWEIPSVMERKEFLNPKNQTKLLPIISEQAGNTRLKLSEDCTPIPIETLNLLYRVFLDEDLHFMTLNYAICLLWLISDRTKVAGVKWNQLALTCLNLSVKINEYSHWDVSDLKITNPEANLKLELEVMTQIFKYKLPIPLMITKEASLYLGYLHQVYKKHSRIEPALFRHFFLVQMVSSLTYTDSKLIGEKQRDLVNVVLSIFFPNIKAKAELRQRLVDLIQNSSLEWIKPELLVYLIL